MVVPTLLRAATRCLALLALPIAVGQGQSAYQDFKGLSRELRSLTDGSKIAKMTSLGSTLGGREVFVVEIANPSGKPAGQRPGLIVVGNLSGDDLVGSANSVEIIRYLLANAAKPEVKKILDEQTIYVFPRLNPDGAEGMFARVKS